MPYKPSRKTKIKKAFDRINAARAVLMKNGIDTNKVTTKKGGYGKKRSYKRRW